MSLVVDKVKCIEESDESSDSDEIYLIVFQGRTVPPFASGLGVIARTAWNDFDAGETQGADVRVASTNSDGVYAVMMVERDDGRDITGDAVVGAWKTQTDLTWKSIMLGMVAGGIPTGTEEAKNAGFAGIRNALDGLSSLYMEFPKGNDDKIDIERVTISQAGQSQTIRFRSPSDKEDATYDVTFKQTAAA
ncbi:MAG: hypothetical protein WAO55_13270 [Candidatus Manganitrophaceae bacterium]